MKKRLLRTVMVLAMVLTMLPMVAFATDAAIYDTWAAAAAAVSGTDYTLDETENTLKIHTALGLAWFADQVNNKSNTFSEKTVQLDANIDLRNAGVVGYSSDDTVSWTAIGTETNSFQGTFDGQNHTVSHVYINNDQDNQGLFGYVSGVSLSTTPSIKNVGVFDSSITTTYALGAAGGLVGCLNGYSLTNCYSTATVSGGYAGSLVGMSGSNSTIENCYATGDVSGNISAGGLVGTVADSTITDCYAIGAVSNGNSAGGFAGTVGVNSTLTNCYAIGAVTGSTSSVGGFAGSEYSTLTNCYYNSETSGCEKGIGQNNNNSSVTALTTQEMTGRSVLYTTALTLNDWTFTAYTLNDNRTVTGYYPVLKDNTQDPAPSADFEGILSWEMAGELAVSVTDYTTNPKSTTIHTALGLAWLANQVNVESVSFQDNTITLTADIDLADAGIESNWTPIGTSAKPFEGTFDGAGCEISGLYINADSDAYQGLFGYVDGATIENLTLSGSVTSTGYYYVGGIAGVADSATIENCTNNATVTGFASSGGIVGLADSASTITDCINTGTITVNGAGASAGGIVGEANNNSTLSGCTNTGDISSTGGVYSSTYYPTAGGIVGYYDANDGYDSLTDCANAGTVTVTDAEGKTGAIYGDCAYPLSNSYTITFDAGSGTATGWTSIQTNTDGVIHTNYELPTASLSGYTFKGWYDENGAEVTATLTFTADTVATASYSKKSSGTSSSSSSTTTTTTTDTTTNDDGSVTATASTSTSTSGSTVTATLSDANMETAIEHAVDADQGDGMYVEIDVTTKSSTDTVAATFSTDAAEALVESHVDALVITSDLGVVTIPSDALAYMADQATDDDLTITVSYVDTADLSDEQAAMVGDAMVVDLTLTSGGAPITSFGDYALTVTLPYTLQAGESAENIVVWYIDDDGTITVLDAVYDADAGTVTFVTTHFSIYAIVHDTNIFTDVDPNAYYYNAVLWAVEHGVTNGTTGTTFSPDMTCTRAQAVTLLWKAYGSPVVNFINPFTDVEAESYYYEAVLWAVAEGITAGTSATTFDPHATCTRGQIVTFLYRAAGSPSVEGDALDVDANSYCYNAVIWAVDNAITTGYADGTFGANNLCNRGQIVTFLYRNLAD